jgi:hypothetical protein
MLRVDRQTVVSLCDRSGVAVRPWVEAGYKAVCVDHALPAGEALRDGILWVGADVRTLRGLRGSPLGVFGWPPCTHFANIGAGAWERKGEAALIEALSIADACMRLAVRCRPVWWMMENPVGRITHFWGPPDHVVSPHEFGGYLIPAADAYTKRTCLWVGGEFQIPLRKPVEPVEGSLVAEVASVQRRSETPRGFARALFETLQPAKPLRSWEPLRSCESLRPGPALRPPTIRPCAWCGTTIEAGRVDQRFCGGRCRVAHHRAKAA